MSFTGGLFLRVGDGGNPEAFNLIPGVFNFSGLGSTNSLLKITGWDSVREEYQPGIAESGDVSIECRRFLNDPIQEALINDAENGLIKNFQLVMDNDTDEEEFIFSVTLSGWQAALSNEETNNLIITGKITNSITRLTNTTSGGFGSVGGGGASPTNTFVEIVGSLSPLNWYRLNETSGLVLADDGMNAIDLPFNQDASTAGFDQPPSTSFTGAGSRAKDFIDPANTIIEPAHSELNDAQDQMTLEFAWQPQVNGGVEIMTRKNVGGFSSTFWAINEDPDDGIRFTFNYVDITPITVSTNFLTAIEVAALIGTYSNISITFDFSGTGLLIIKVDDVEKANVDISLFGPMETSPGAGNDEKIVIGGDSSRFWGGGCFLDEIRIYDKVLTAQERTDTYNLWKFGSKNPV